MESSDISYQLLDYENEWVALLESGDKIVGHGNDAYEAKMDAERNGYPDVVLLRVRDSESHYCPAFS
jgi:hypothetical protein